MSSFLVVMDANVLVPAVLCDFVLRAASADMYRLVWTDDILDEVRRTLIIDLDKSVAQAGRRIAAMKAAFPEALITQRTPLIPAMTNDPKDRHVLAAAVASGAQVMVSSFFGAKFGKHVEEMLVAPLPNWIIVLGYVGGGLVRGLLVGGAVTIVSLTFTKLHVHHALVIVAAVVLTSVIFALGGFINALFAKNFDQVNWIPTFVLTPLTYFGGVFYSITLLPEWARHVSYANPILHMVNAFRFGFLGTSDVNVYVAFTIMLASAILMFAIAVFFMNRGTGMRE